MLGSAARESPASASGEGGEHLRTISADIKRAIGRVRRYGVGAIPTETAAQSEPGLCREIPARCAHVGSTGKAAVQRSAAQAQHNQEVRWAELCAAEGGKASLIAPSCERREKDTCCVLTLRRKLRKCRRARYQLQRSADEAREGGGQRVTVYRSFQFTVASERVPVAQVASEDKQLCAANIASQNVPNPNLSMLHQGGHCQGQCKSVPSPREGLALKP